MTIFSDAFRHFLVERIIHIRDKSSAADHSLGNKILKIASFGTFGRDKNLSQTKRTLADEFILELKAMPGEDDDEKNFDNFNTIITLYKEKGAQASKKKGYSEGEFGIAMEDNFNFLNSFFKKLDTLDLLNIPHDTDPLHIFYYHASLYFGEKINHPISKQLFDKLIQNPNFTRFAELTEAKSTLLTKTLRECKHDLETLNPNHNDYEQTRQTRVLEALEKVDKGNKKLCKDYSKYIDLPVTLAWFVTFTTRLPAIRPVHGTLGHCIEKARIEIDSINELEDDLSSVSQLST